MRENLDACDVGHMYLCRLKNRSLERPKMHEDLDGGEYLFAFRMLMVLFRREFSFVDALYLWELMWAMEYNPNIFSSYEESSPSADKSSTLNTNGKMLKKCGKFERKNVKTGYKNQHSSLAVFLVASVLATKNKRFLKEAKGLDDVVKILGDITGNLDAKKACNEALKLHKKYLSKVNPTDGGIGSIWHVTESLLVSLKNKKQ
ncbi:hypothetical protein CK203_101398 [Vitis vinifera]|uniref:Rab-GAP TBC domain-containing protein n=1 Tax=Vitis vinifera TaxID=29760 RepID=A0A438F1D5_VITVI|nr:hypothetical protein CK203_101398 [Vitis vinifera]